MQLFQNANYDFLKWRIPALVLSWVIILGGLAVIGVRGLPLGIEFSGGTIVILQFDTMPQVDAVRDAVDKALPGRGRDAMIQQYGDAAQRQVMIRVPEVGAEQGAQLGQTADTLINSLKGGPMGNFSVVGTEIVGPMIGEDLKNKGTMATVLSLVGILAYIAFRFRLSFAVGAVVATIHDLLVTLAFLAFFRYDLSLNVIAAILTVTGYSTNDTIVIFDRVRENLGHMRREGFNATVNAAINQTLGRTVLTAGTTLISAVALLLFGGEVLRGFAFTMVVGVITGTYSSVFIAAAIVTFWRKTADAKNESAATAKIAASAAARAGASGKASVKKSGNNKGAVAR